MGVELQLRHNIRVVSMMLKVGSMERRKFGSLKVLGDWESSRVPEDYEYDLLY